jgi:hypothetical protein
LLQLSNHIKDLSLPPTTTDLNVYIDVAAAMSGVSLFGQRAANLTIPGVKWTFHKSGYEEEHSLEITGFDKFTHLLSETADISPAFRVIETIQGNPAFNFRRVTIDKSDAIYILERIDWSERNLAET